MDLTEYGPRRVRRNDTMMHPQALTILAQTGGDARLWLSLAVSLSGAAAVTLGVLALFGRSVEAQINPQRRIAIARGLRDRRTPFEWRATAPALWMLWRFVGRLRLPEFKRRLNRALVAAGSPGFFTADEYLALTLAAALAVAAAAVVADALMRGHSSAVTALLALLAAMAIGLYYPWDRARKRARRIGRQVPYTLDLISLAMGAGGTFTEAIATIVGEDPDDPFNVELRTVLTEIELGATRSRALANLSGRIPLESLRSIVASVIQAEKLGTPLVEVLKGQAELLRRQRSVRAEKLAALASVRILLPSMIILLSVVLTIFAPIILRAARGGLFH